MTTMKTNQSWTIVLSVAFAGLLSAAPAPGQVPRTDADQVRARQRISTMEGVLERAVMNGADNLLRQVDSVMPDAVMLTGAPQVRGFRLEGYGIFFDVGVPVLHLSVTWPLRTLLNDTRAASMVLAELKSKMAQMSPREQETLMPLVRRLEMTFPAVPPAPPRATGAAVSGASLVPPGQPTSLAPPPVAPVDPDVVNDPNEGWTREVKAALMEAMIESSGPLSIGGDEWLTVAARDNVPRDPLVPGATVDFSTVVFRVKGSDLAEYHARRLTLEQALERVEVREY
jgi:hypothetical protein